jgi:uridine phosphorylase
MNPIPESELIIRPDGQIYHLNLFPEQIADTIILVGDQERVSVISSYFDTIEHKVNSREFFTHTGYLNGKHLTVLSTGIGTDNIDIVLNELDALVNIDLKTRLPKTVHKSLNLIRIGTTGALQDHLEIDKPVFSKYSIGFDGLLNYYKDRNKVAYVDMENAFTKFVNWNKLWNAPYFVKSSDKLFNLLVGDASFGITISAPGFYGPQGRKLRLELMEPEINNILPQFEYDSLKITNYEMESSALYGLSNLLGHEALTVCNVIANRQKKQYSKDYHASLKLIIEDLLQKLTK